jgi:hypothetical protein
VDKMYKDPTYNFIPVFLWEILFKVQAQRSAFKLSITKVSSALKHKCDETFTKFSKGC